MLSWAWPGSDGLYPSSVVHPDTSQLMTAATFVYDNVLSIDCVVVANIETIESMERRVNCIIRTRSMQTLQDQD